MKAHIHVTLKKGVLDPQGKAIENALKTLGFNNVKSVRQGKFIEIDIDENDPKQAESQAKQMSNKLLANTVIENFHVDILENQ
ncbi:MAG: phosphoribosylformylglycinamidine synthase [Rhodospirillaceae bacterium]|jgi:phosphoribosylformylglycinamidine synthase|nr:phosphoribosylformylglycinamidine synthase [Rhodospirillaceae bacterium]MDG1273895.1 phosphoribosylformylglycinamidine synthase subunit PurS [Alphaproteobacteria bacterium]